MQAARASDGPTRPIFGDRDESDLRWFFGLGQSEFCKSPSGFMLERAAALAETSEGERVISLAQYRSRVWTYHQRGCTAFDLGETRLYDDATADILRRAAAPFVDEFDPEADAWFTSSEEHNSPQMPSDVAMRRFGRISRRLRAVSGTCYAALAMYHGLTANRYEGHVLGRLVVLYAMTEGGQRILAARAERLGSEEDAGSRPEERISSEYQRQLQSPSTERRRLFDMACKQASELRSTSNAAYAASGVL